MSHIIHNNRQIHYNHPIALNLLDIPVILWQHYTLTTMKSLINDAWWEPMRMCAWFDMRHNLEILWSDL